MILYIITTENYQKQNRYKVGQATNFDDRMKGYKTGSPEKWKKIYTFEMAEGITDHMVHDALASIGVNPINEGGGTEWFEMANPIPLVQSAYERVLKGEYRKGALDNVTKFVNFWDPVDGELFPSAQLIFQRLSHLRQTKFHDRQNADTPIRTANLALKAVDHVDTDKRFLVWFNMEFVYLLSEHKFVPRKNIWLYTECDEKAKVAQKYGVNVLRNLAEVK